MKLLDRRFLDVSLVVKGIIDEPYGYPTVGSQFIVGSEPNGMFTGFTPNSIAKYTGNGWDVIKPQPYTLEVFNVDTGEILTYNGTNWIAVASFAHLYSGTVHSFITSGYTIPATAAKGDKFLLFDTEGDKLYTATDTDTWDEGSIPPNGSQYVSTSNHTLYSSNGSAIDAHTLQDGASFFCKADGKLYVYDADNHSFISPADSAGGSAETVTETHTLTMQEAVNKSFTLAHSIANGQNSNILCFVCGVAQAVNTDFTASGNTISWDNKGLDDIGLEQGDTFILHYVKA